MNLQFDIWQLIGGLGLFLYAMSQLELALRSFAGRNLKRFLQNHTDSAPKAVVVGTITTAIVQSSSLVSLMVLAFVGAGVMALENGLGVIFGANLGTTLTGWMVATLGFKFDLTVATLPLIGVGALMLVALRGRWGEFGRILVSIGFLLMGLGLMKDSVGAISTSFDIESLAQLALWQYLLIGVVFAAIVQSSSATMLIALAALHSGIIELPAAAALAVGADLGTTSTVIIGAVKGAAVKKRAALAHVIFNTVTAVIGFSLLTQLLQATQWLGFSDPLFRLVAFHSLFNLVGVILFMPLVKPFARALNKRFQHTGEKTVSRFVNETAAVVVDAAMVAVEQETAHLIGRVIWQNMRVFSPPLPLPPGRAPVPLPATPLNGGRVDFVELYRSTKQLEGEILSFALTMQTKPMEQQDSARLNRLLSAVRHAVHAAKSISDVRHNLEDFADSPIEEINEFLDHFKSTMTQFYGDLFSLRSKAGTSVMFHDFPMLIKRAQASHDKIHAEIYADIPKANMREVEISSLLNVNRELLNANLSLLIALQEYGLTEAESAALTQLSARS